MVKISVFLTRRSDLTRAAFNAHWSETHTPLLTSMPEMQEFVRRYVQLRTVDVPGSDLPIAAYDGVAEIWVDDLQSASELLASASYRTVVAKDEEEFLDRSKTVVLLSEETTIVG